MAVADAHVYTTAITRQLAALLRVASTDRDVEDARQRAHGAAWMLAVIGRLTASEVVRVGMRIERDTTERRRVLQLAPGPESPAAPQPPPLTALPSPDGTAGDLSAVDALRRARHAIDAGMTGAEARAAIEQLIDDLSAPRLRAARMAEPCADQPSGALA